MKRKIETIFSGIFTLQFPEFEIADHDVKRVEEGAKESWYSIPETAFDKITPEESGSRSEQKITQVIDGIDLDSLLQHETCLKAGVKIEFLQKLADVHEGVYCMSSLSIPVFPSIWSFSWKCWLANFPLPLQNILS